MAKGRMEFKLCASDNIPGLTLEKLSDCEADVVKANFSLADLNGDGTLLLKEWEKFANEANNRMREGFKKCDSDNKPGLTWEECSSCEPKAVETEAIFDKLDSDRNGILLLEELEKFMVMAMS